MGLLHSIRTWFSGRAESRKIAGSESWLSAPSLAGVIVNEDTAPTFGAVYACLVVLASDLSSIPFLVMKREPGGGRAIDFGHPNQDLVFHSPDGEMSALGWIGSATWHLNTHGNSYTRIERDPNLQPEKLVLLDPRKVESARSKSGKLHYKTDEGIVLAEDMLHVANVGFNGIDGKSPIRMTMETLGVGMAAEKFGAAYYGNGINQKGILTTPDTLDQVERDQLRKEIQDQHGGPYNASRFLLLQGGMTFQTTLIPNDEAQFIATRKFQLEECCRIFRVPPTKVQNLDRANFANLEEVNLDYYNSSLKPWAKRFESEFNRKLFTRPERKTFAIEHDISGLLNGRILDQAQADKIYREMGVSNADEIRAMRNRGGPIEGGKTYFVPLNMAPLDKVAAASIETLKGVKALAPPDVEGDEVDAPAALVDAVRANVEDVARRMSRREANALRKILKKGDLRAILPDLDDHYAAEPQVLAEALAPSLAAYALATRTTIDPRDFARLVVERSRSAILKAVEAPESLRLLTDLVTCWESGKTSEILAMLPAPGVAS